MTTTHLDTSDISIVTMGGSIVLIDSKEFIDFKPCGLLFTSYNPKNRDLFLEKIIDYSLELKRNIHEGERRYICILNRTDKNKLKNVNDYFKINL